MKSRLPAGRVGFVVCILMAALLAPGGAMAVDMPLSQVKPGAWGQAKTVFKGFKIETFNVKVIDILPQGGIDGGDLILVELSGGNVKANGGVSMGMSGSPVYINNKLVGAISIAFPFTDGSLAGVTPIENMRMAAGGNRETGMLTPLPPGAVEGKDFLALETAPSGVDPDRVLVGVPVTAPVMVSGLNQRTFDFLKAKLDRPYLTFINRAGTGGVDAGDLELKPGGAMGIQLTDGDIQISAIGTATDVVDSQVLVFGHPFLFKGPIQYLLSHAYVHDVIVGMDVSYKMASPAGVIGTAYSDRAAAVAARLKEFPRIIPVEIQVNDLDTGRKTTTSVQIVRDQDIAPDLLATVLMQAVDQTIDRIGEGTSWISYTLTTDYKGRKLERQDAYYSRYDISAYSLGEIYELALVLAENIYEEVNINRLQVSLDVQKARRTATIEDVEPNVEQDLPPIATAELTITFGAGSAQTKPSSELDSEDIRDEIEDKEEEKQKDMIEEEEQGEEPEEEEIEEDEETLEAMPGESVVFEVTLKPFRQEEFTREVALDLPEDMPPGVLQLSVRSGGWESYITPQAFDIDAAEDADYSESMEPDMEEIEDLDDLFDKIDERRRSDEILIECVSFEPEMEEDADAVDCSDAEDPDLCALEAQELEDAFEDADEEDSDEDALEDDDAEDDEEDEEDKFKCEDLKTTLTTQWVIEGEEEVIIEVVEP